MEILDKNKKEKNKEEQIFNNDFLKENTFNNNEIKYEKLEEDDMLYGVNEEEKNYELFKEVKKEPNDVSLYEVKEYENQEKEKEKENNNKLRIKFDDSILEDNEKKENLNFTNKTNSNMLDENSLLIDNNEYNNIKIDFEELEELEELEGNDKNKTIKEIDLSLENQKITKLNKPDVVYYNLYKEAKKRANELKKISLQAYMEAENIKKTYLLDNSDLNDLSDLSDFDD